jgi:hypothetical protein
MQIRFRHGKLQFVELLPHQREGRSQAVDGLQIDLVVVAVQLDGAERLEEDLHEILHNDALVDTIGLDASHHYRVTALPCALSLNRHGDALAS